MPLITLHAIETTAVDGYHGALYITQIILAQLLSFPIKDCAISAGGLANSSVTTPGRPPRFQPQEPRSHCLSKT
jgi:hypothetical protein